MLSLNVLLWCVLCCVLGLLLLLVKGCLRVDPTVVFLGRDELVL